MDKVLGAVEMVQDHRMREEEIRHREFENHRRMIANARRLVDQKVQQLRAVGELSTLLTGFTLVSLCQSAFGGDILNRAFPDVVNWLFGFVTASVTALCIIPVIFSALILVAVLNFDIEKSCMPGQASFSDFWRQRCEKDWRFAVNSFIYGVTVFILDLPCLGWIQFWEKPVAPILMSVVSGLFLLVWLLALKPSWSSGITAKSWTSPFNKYAVEESEQTTGPEMGGATDAAQHTTASTAPSLTQSAQFGDRSSQSPTGFRNPSAEIDVKSGV